MSHKMIGLIRHTNFLTNKPHHRCVTFCIQSNKKGCWVNTKTVKLQHLYKDYLDVLISIKKKKQQQLLYSSPLFYVMFLFRKEKILFFTIFGGFLTKGDANMILTFL